MFSVQKHLSLAGHDQHRFHFEAVVEGRIRSVL